MAAGGIAVGDLNGDDLPDLFFVGGPAENAGVARAQNNLAKILSEGGTGVARNTDKARSLLQAAISQNLNVIRQRSN